MRRENPKWPGEATELGCGGGWRGAVRPEEWDGVGEGGRREAETLWALEMGDNVTPTSPKEDFPGGCAGCIGDGRPRRQGHLRGG